MACLSDRAIAKDQQISYK